MSEIAAHGCGSQEIQGERAQERVNALCEVYQQVRRGGVARDMRAICARRPADGVP